MKTIPKLWPFWTAVLSFTLSTAGTAVSGQVKFADLEGRPAANLTERERGVIQECISETLSSWDAKLGLRTAPPEVFLFADTTSFVATTGLPPHHGGAWREGMILLQPPATLRKFGGVKRVVMHETLHHFFGTHAERLTPEAQEALAHLYSGGAARKSKRALKLAGAKRSYSEEEELYSHYAWMLMEKRGEKKESEFLSELMAGKVDCEDMRLAVASPPDGALKKERGCVAEREEVQADSVK